MKPIRCPKCNWDWLRGPSLKNLARLARDGARARGERNESFPRDEGKDSMAMRLSWALSNELRQAETLILTCNRCGNEFEIPRATAEHAIMKE